VKEAAFKARKKIRDAESYLRNRSARQAANKAWRMANKDRIKGQQNSWRENNRRVQLLYGAKNRALKKGMPFSITVDDLLWPDVCPVLGVTLNYAAAGSHGLPDSASLDRTIPSLGYVKGNVVVMSLQANRLKYNATLADLRKLTTYLERIA
jgi:hypothetical protein